jgi:signal transduction histidine kinase
VRLVRGARRADDLRLVIWAALPALVAGVHDVTARIAGAGVIYLLEHALPFSSLSISYVLTRRFLRARDELGLRTVELTRSHDELSLVQEELVRKEQLAAVGELAAVVAHEVRNPLAILKNAVSSLRRENLPEADRHTCLSVLDEEVERLNRLVRDLLAYARPVAPQSVPVQLGDIVDKAIEHARRGSRRRDGVTFDVDLSGAPETVHGDRDLLEQALINIVENAMEAMEEGGVVTVRAKETAAAGRDAVAVTFHDTGEGMDTLVRSRARDPFFTTRPYGTGLGLAIVERVARAHGGTVEITSSRDSGTAVTLVLPR